MTATSSRPRSFGVSMIGLLFLLGAIAALMIAAFLLLSPNGGAGVDTLFERLSVPAALSNLLAVPPLLTAGLAGLIFRGLWQQSEWARVAAVIFTFLMALTAVAAIAFLFAFDLADARNLAYAAIALILFALGFVVLLRGQPEKQVKMVEPEEIEVLPVAMPPAPEFIEREPADRPPPRVERYESPDLVPPPPRSHLDPAHYHSAETIASRPDKATQRLPAATVHSVESVVVPSAWLIVRQGPDLSQRFEIYPDQSLVLGRDPARAGALLSDPAVSGQHAQIRPAQGRFFLEDLGSTNGIYINNQRTQRQMLNEGDELRLGATTLLFTTRP